MDETSAPANEVVASPSDHNRSHYILVFAGSSSATRHLLFIGIPTDTATSHFVHYITSLIQLATRA